MVERMNMTVTEATFSPARTRMLLRRLCSALELPFDGAVLLRHQTNAVYLLPSASMVVKVSRPGVDPSRAAHVVQLVRWLTEVGYPSVRLVPDIAQPQPVGNCVATFWEYLPQRPDQPVGGAELGSLLRELHRLPDGPVPLEPLDALAAIRRSIAAAPIVREDERRVLTEQADALDERMGELAPTGRSGLIHADPQGRNALWEGEHALLADWDSAAWGVREWDLVTIEVHHRRFGGPAGDYRRFCQAYGVDVRDWPGYDAIRRLRELRMITTNARKSPAGSAAAREVHRRIALLAEDDAAAGWKIL